MSSGFPTKVLGLVGVGRAPVGRCDLAGDVVQAAGEKVQHLRLGSGRPGLALCCHVSCYGRKSAGLISLYSIESTIVVVQLLKETPAYAIIKKQTVHGLTEGHETRENTNTRYG